MERRSLRSRARGFFELSHPVPMLFQLIGITLFIVLAAWPHVVWARVALLVAPYMAMQSAIAMLNDYCDRRLDAAGKPYRPIPSGVVTPREAVAAGCVMIGLMAVLLVFVPPLARLMVLGYLALGLAFDFRFKGSPLSGGIFALAMPLIPLYAFAGVERRLPFLPWLVPLGFLLGVTLNLANALPDLEDDEAGSARTLAVALGVKRSFLVAKALLVASALLVLLLHVSGTLVAEPKVLTGTLVLAALLLVAIQLSTGAEKPRATRKAFFHLVTLVSLVLAGGWLIGVLMRS
jgi:4-hydroxybenzoate polyprenyltransferase